jgi:hypothetical protein
VIKSNLLGENIFPFLGFWNIQVCSILRIKFPPEKSSQSFADTTLEIDKNSDFSKYTIWELICTEAIDTEYSHIYYTRVYEEILRRGICVREFKKARKFMWLTAGWLNFKLMLWEWITLDEEHIKNAIDIQYERHYINERKKEIMYKYIDKINEIDREYKANQEVSKEQK